MKIGALRRLERLESAAAVSDTAPADAWRWLDDADPAVQDYVVRVLTWAHDADADAETVGTRHPALWDIWERYTGFERYGIFGAPSLTQVQARVLHQARMRLLEALAEEHGGYPAAHGLVWEAMLGIPKTAPPGRAWETPNGFMMAQSEEAFARQWRISGTRDPRLLAVMCLWSPERALLLAEGSV